MIMWKFDLVEMMIKIILWVSGGNPTNLFFTKKTHKVVNPMSPNVIYMKQNY